jgi:hypothetical protein
MDKDKGNGSPDKSGQEPKKPAFRLRTFMMLLPLFAAGLFQVYTFKSGAESRRKSQEPAIADDSLNMVEEKNKASTYRLMLDAVLGIDAFATNDSIIEEAIDAPK